MGVGPCCYVQSISSSACILDMCLSQMEWQVGRNILSTDENVGILHIATAEVLTCVKTPTADRCSTVHKSRTVQCGIALRWERAKATRMRFLLGILVSRAGFTLSKKSLSITSQSHQPGKKKRERERGETDWKNSDLHTLTAVSSNVMYVGRVLEVW